MMKNCRGALTSKWILILLFFTWYCTAQSYCNILPGPGTPLGSSSAPGVPRGKGQDNLRSWLLESDAADQFSVIHKGGEEVSVFVNNNPDPVEIQTRPRYTNIFKIKAFDD